MTGFLLLLSLTITLTQSTHTTRHADCPVILQPDQPASANRVRHTTQIAARRLPSSSTSSPSRQRASRIVNGHFVTSSTLQQIVVAIANQYPSSNSFCSGSLIAPSWVLTAAHCESAPAITSVFVGTQRIFSMKGRVFFNGGVQIFVQRAINHPQYFFDDPLRRAHDIALLQLERPALSPTFMHLNVDSAQPKQASFSRVMGYGSVVFMDEEPSATKGRLRQVDVPIFSNERCKQQYNNQILPDRQVCAGYNQRECGSCQGDSGGPLFQYDEDNNAVQVGIVSFAEDCGQPGKPTVYVRPDAYIEWIREMGAEFTSASDIRAVFSAGSDSISTSSSSAAIIGGIVATIAFIISMALVVIFAKRHRASDRSDVIADGGDERVTNADTGLTRVENQTADDEFGRVAGGEMVSGARNEEV